MQEEGYDVVSPHSTQRVQPQKMGNGICCLEYASGCVTRALVSEGINAALQREARARDELKFTRETSPSPTQHHPTRLQVLTPHPEVVSRDVKLKMMG